MLERQEIDALLISALYGELTPAEETRLAAHLDAHPTDKTALAALTSTRDTVRESRILSVQLEPPQSVSALLLQEAARRARKPADEREGWFARFARSFMAHPAMAAAAMLVVVIGVATLVSNRKGDQFSESSAPAVSNEVQPATADQTVAAGRKPEPKLDDGVAYGTGLAQAGSGSAAATGSDSSDSYKVSLAEGSDKNVDKLVAEQAKLQRQIAKSEVAKADAAKPDTKAIARGQADGDETGAATKAKDTKKGTAKSPSGSYLELRPPEPAPKDFEATTPTAPAQGRVYNYEDDLAKEQVNTITPGPGTVGGAGTGSGAAVTAPRTGSTSNTKAPPPVTDSPKAAEKQTTTKSNGTSATNTGPAPRTQTPARNVPATAQPAPPSPPPAKTATNTSSNIRDDRSSGEKPRAATPPEDKAANDPQLAWAREQHTTIIARVRAGDCKGAANVAVNLANRDLGYYKQNVATDRSVKECLAYIDNAREKDSEQRAERSRATQKRATEPSKRAADQPSKPADTSKATTTDATH